MSANPQPPMQVGPQPLDQVLIELELENHAVVEAGRSEQLTHKQVQKARKGRRITKNLQQKIVRAVSVASGKTYTVESLFNY